MRNDNMYGLGKGLSVSGESAMVSNQKGENAVYSEWIRMQMVQFKTRNEMLLNITENDQHTNKFSFSMSYIKEKMMFG